MTVQQNISSAENILAALAAALPELEGAKKNAANPHFKSKYADLGSVIEAIRPIAQHGLWYRQVSHERDDGACIETFYIHATGELSAGTILIPADRKNAQAFGSAQTYARRYGLQSAFGLATEDDDGNAATSAPPRDRAVSPPAEMPDSEWARLVQLLEAAKADRKAMLDYFKVPDLRRLNQQQYGEAIDLLNAKLAKLAKDETDAKAKEAA